MPDEKAPPEGVKLLDQVRGKIRLKHYSIRTEQAYVDWIKRFILHHDKRHPRELGAAEVEAFLTHLAVAGKVAASTQNQAKSALLFLYQEVLGTELPWLDNVERAEDAEAPAGGADARRGAGAADAALRHALVDGEPALRRWTATDGVLAVACEGYRFRAQGNPGARRQGLQGPRDDVAGGAGRTLARASGAGERAASAGFGRGLWRGVSARCAGA